MKSLRIFTALFSLCFLSNSFACTGFFLEGSSNALVAKTLDWIFDQGKIYINKRNMHKTAGLVGDQKAATWTSKYMSITLSQDGREFPWEGLNEKGLSVNVFQLIHSVVPEASNPLPAVEVTQWIQYILDTSANVSEAVQNAKKVRISQTMREEAGYQPETTAHYMVCDASSQCAIFEYNNGELDIYEKGKNLAVSALTNNRYEQSLQYYYEHLDDMNDVGNTKSNSLDRFVRAAHWSRNALRYDTTEVSAAFRALRNVAQYNPQMSTQWSMVFELKEQKVHISTARAKALKHITLNQFNPSCLSPVKTLDINSRLSGNLTMEDFNDYSKVENQALLNENALLSFKLKKIMGDYPSTMTRCIE